MTLDGASCRLPADPVTDAIADSTNALGASGDCKWDSILLLAASEHLAIFISQLNQHVKSLLIGTSPPWRF